ncbi:MAG: NACHT domain-containing protein [Myxococcota bacterium]
MSSSDPTSSGRGGWRVRSRPQTADRILCVCTATYKHRFDGEVDEGHDTGVRFEGPLIRQRINEARGTQNHGVGVVVFDRQDLPSQVPYVLRPTTQHALIDDAAYEGLYAWILGQPGVQADKLGKLRPAEVRSEGLAALWAPEPDLSRFRKRLRGRLDTLPAMFQQHGQRLLSDVFVELQLKGDRDRVGGDWWSSESAEGRLVPGTPARLPAVLDVEHRAWVLLGDPGSGKTTLLRRFALQLLEAPDGPVLIFLRVAELGEGGSLERLLTNDPTHGRVVEPLIRRVATGDAVILLDGLDEHPEPGTARRIVDEIALEAESCTVVVTSRPIGYESPAAGRFRELQLCPLSETSQAELLGRWVSDPERVARELTNLASRPRMKRIAENPLLLTLVGLVLQEHDEELPHRRSELYRGAIECLLNGVHADARRGHPAAEAR